MAKCIACGGTKHRFVEVLFPMYRKGTTRIYQGPCRVCDAQGNVFLPLDAKQRSAGENRADTAHS